MPFGRSKAAYKRGRSDAAKGINENPYADTPTNMGGPDLRKWWEQGHGEVADVTAQTTTETSCDAEPEASDAEEQGWL